MKIPWKLKFGSTDRINGKPGASQGQNGSKWGHGSFGDSDMVTS